MSYFTQAFLMSFGMGMSLGVCTVVAIRNGVNNTPLHTFVTLASAHVVDVTMMLLYYLGASFIFNIRIVEIVLYLLGIIMLGKIALTNILNANKSLDSDGGVAQSLWKSALDGVIMAGIPSSLIFWVTTVGTALVGTTEHLPTYLLACLGVIAGFETSNIIWVILVIFIDKLSNNKVLIGVNYLSGTILIYIVITFIIQLLELL